MFVRITEHLLSLRVMSCLNEGVVNNEKSGTLTKLLSNINTRGVRGGNFQLKFDGPKLEPISLNVSHAETISAPPEAFSSTFPHILDGVAENEQFPQTLSSGLQTALGWPTNTITYYDLEKKIWETYCLFRGSTEGGEHCHYLHQCIYYAHSSRGGGWRKEEPILALFKWTFRRLREKIEQAGQTGEFLKFVRQRI